MSEEREPAVGEADELRVVVDAQLVLAMFLARRDHPEWRSPKRQLLKLLAAPSFHWLWSPDVSSDYERGALAIESDGRIRRRAVFDRLGFELFLGALRLAPAVRVSATTMRKARRRIEQAPRAAERDLDDAIYLACAVDGGAHLITTEDSDEFRPFGAVKHRRRDLPLRDYLAARPPRLRLHLPDYLAVHSTATPVSRRFSLRRATRAATPEIVFSGCFPPLRPGSQQAAAVKIFFTTHHYQQDFSFTHSDLRSLGDEYEGVRILSWDEFLNYTRERGLLAAKSE